MVLEGESKLFKHSKAKTFYLTIPSSVANDSNFPFKESDTVQIKIKDSKLIVEK